MINMSKRWIIGLSILVPAAIVLTLGAAWLLSLPADARNVRLQVPSPKETVDTINALKREKPGRPTVAVVGINDATETTDYLMTIGILRRADVADVVGVSTTSGPVQLYPALRVIPDTTTAQFSAAHPSGADYVIVPAMEPDNDPAALKFISDQAAKGATIVAVCAGAKVAANAGILRDRKATTHWYFLPELLKAHPDVRYVADRRFIVDGNVATTTGISASMPMMLTLIEAIGGRDKAREVAQGLGVSTWDARHSSEAFRLTRPFVLTVMQNRAAVFGQDVIGLPLTAGVDEVTLALTADAWSRTYRSKVRTFSASGSAARSRNGVAIIPDEIASVWPRASTMTVKSSTPPAYALDSTLAKIAERYGARTRKIVSMQLEYQKR